MENQYQYIIYGILGIAVILAIFAFTKLDISFFGFKLKGDKNTRRNNADVDGTGNTIKMSSNSSTTPADNTAKVRGDENDLEMR